MKLTIKELAPYLPYGLKIIDSYNGQIHSIDKGETLDYVLQWYKGDKPHKIILRPLSDLTKEIEHNGERFVPYDRTTEGMMRGRSYQDRIIIENRLATNTILYQDMIYLISLHFDVFSLIENNLAIDINTLNN